MAVAVGGWALGHGDGDDVVPRRQEIRVQVELRHRVLRDGIGDRTHLGVADEETKQRCRVDDQGLSEL